VISASSVADTHSTFSSDSWRGAVPTYAPVHPGITMSLISKDAARSSRTSRRLPPPLALTTV
jgi:hypothetical protein